MEFSSLTMGAGVALRHNWRLRAAAVLAAFALVFTLVVIVQQPAEASNHASVAAASVAADVSSQIDIRQFVCPILLSIRAAFANSPFFAFVAAAINPILVAFGCIVS